ncbi:hypothetical protein C4564_00240 [Candidatus Microgenomates bacterium]|nr:MAG: hypothetical protein C4564_00240 [Candidatus Microgenomates bacterium]
MKDRKIIKDLKEGVIKGFAWSIGVTIGFAFITTVVAVVLSRLDTIPVIGGFVASIVKETLRALNATTI